MFRYKSLAPILFPFLAGLAVGLVGINVPELHFNSDIRLIEVVNLILTIILAFFIPFSIKKWIDDNGNIKTFLVDEVKKLITTIDKIKEIISNCYSLDRIGTSQKEQINTLFYEAELQLDSLSTQFEISFENDNTRKLMEEAENDYLDYHQNVTGGDLMSSSFTSIPKDFYIDHCKQHSDYGTKLRGLIHYIHKL